ncbi:MAG: molybdenum cofactor guanylyltransferase [Opitutales bacterium]|nr:molybdenum cofactor guanylyltransferase [Opitutales bacterium]
MSLQSVNALLLAGGRSRRMHRDKATLIYGGRTQLERAAELLSELCPVTYLSLRKGQDLPADGPDLPTIEDAYGEIGPLGGMLSAFSTHPDNAWLVVACDLPFLGPVTLRHLLRERDTDRIATAYRSARDGLPEPLCAIYEPSAFRELSRFWEEEKMRCPRKILIRTEPKLLDPVDHRALDNVNTPEEYDEAAAKLTATA